MILLLYLRSQGPVHRLLYLLISPASVILLSQRLQLLLSKQSQADIIEEGKGIRVRRQEGGLTF